MKRILQILVLSSALAVISACASTPSNPFKSKADFGSEVSKVSKTWKKGEAEIEKGENLIQGGNKLVRKGNDAIADSRSDERKDKDRLATAKRDYNAAIELTVASDVITEEVGNPKVIKALGKTVESAESSLKKAQRKQKQGRDMVADGKSKIKKGEKLIQDGRDRMEKAEESYRIIGS